MIDAGTEKNIIRVLSPLVIDDELLNKGSTSWRRSWIKIRG